MLATDIPSLWEEISTAERRRDSKLRSLPDQLKRYAGAWYDGQPSSTAEPDFENHAYEAVSSFVPQTVAQKPRVKVGTRRPTSQRNVAKALQGHVNRWIRDSHYKTVLERLAVDFQFRWCVALVSVKPRPEAYESDDPLLMQQVDRISVGDFCWDSMAPEPSKARWMSHRYKMDHDDLIGRAEKDAELSAEDREGWNLAAVRALSPGMADSRRAAVVSDTNDEYRIDRQEIELYDIYIAEETNHVEQGRGAEFTQANGYAGTLRTIAVSMMGPDGNPLPEGKRKGTEVREPRPYFGPPQGPYVIGGAYIVPDQSEPLSPLVVTQAQANNVNAFTASMVRQGLNYCRKIIASGLDVDDAESINAAKHDHITILSNPINVATQLQTFETGGITQQHIVIAQWLRDILERVSGLSGALKGEIDANATATAVSEGVEAGKARASYPQDKFMDFAEECLRRVLWFGYHVEQIIEPLGQEAADLISDEAQGEGDRFTGAQDPRMLGEGTETWFFGGDFEEGSGGTFADLELEIDLYSMRRSSEATQARKSQVIERVVLGMGPAMVEMPWIKWREIIDTIGDLENLPDLSDQFDWAKLSEMSGGSLQAPSAAMTRTNAGRIGAEAPGFRASVPNFARFAKALGGGGGQQAPGALPSGPINGAASGPAVSTNGAI